MKYLFWLIPLTLFLLQFLMTLNSFNQVRFEELIESVQAPWWFEHKLVLAGTHTNIGWYALLAGVYSVFGFSLNTPKIVLLFIWAISLFCQAVLIRRFFTPIPGAIILLTLGLSPTILFFNTQSLHLGVSLMTVPVFILLLVSLNFKKMFLSYLLEVFIFLLAMFVALIYPPFVFYIPAIVIFYLWKLRKNWSFLHLSVAIIGFLLPLILGFFYIQNKNILIYDENSGTGLFRGGGQISVSADTFSKGWAGLLSDFFIKSVSYHFEVKEVDFSLIFPILTVVFVLYSTLRIYQQNKQARPLINLALFVMVSNLAVISITSDYGVPGMKRSTPTLAGIYFLWVVVWYYLAPHPSLRASAKQSRKENDVKRKISYLILSLLTLHHLIVYPVNFMHIKDPSPFKVTDWFDPAPSDGAGFDEQNPQKSVDEYVSMAERGDLMLDCRPHVEKFGGCVYDFIYSAVAGSCKWNKLNCHSILGYDSKTGEFIPLSVDLWQRGYWVE